VPVRICAARRTIRGACPIATPIPVPGQTPTVLLDAGANAECTPTYLLQFAQMGAAFATARYGMKEPKVALLSIGEEETKGTALVKETHALLGGTGLNFVGNVEGRDLMSDTVDVVVTDGFTGNVALKTLEGGLKFLVDAVLGALSSSEEAKRVSHVLLDALAPVALRHVQLGHLALEARSRVVEDDPAEADDLADLVADGVDDVLATEGGRDLREVALDLFTGELRVVGVVDLLREVKLDEKRLHQDIIAGRQTFNVESSHPQSMLA